MKKIVSILLACLLVLALSSVAFANEAVKSIGEKDAPKVDVKDGDGQTVNVDVTPYSERENKDADTEQRLNDAFDELKNNQYDTIKNELDGLAKKIDPDYSAGNFTVQDVIDVNIQGYVSGTTYNVTIMTDLGAEDDVPVVVVKTANGWQVVDSSNIVKNADGSITFKTTVQGVYALLKIGESSVISVPVNSKVETEVNGSKTVIQTSGVTSPQTGETNNYATPIIIACGIVVVAIAVAFIVSRKKTNN